MDLSEISKALASIENNLKAFSEKAEGEIKSIGKVSTDTQAAIDSIGLKQREFADELLQLKQRGTALDVELKKDLTWGEQFVKTDSYAAFVSGNAQKTRVEIKNTMTGSDTNVAPDRKPGIVGGAFLPLTIESLFPAVPTSSNAIEFTKENVFTNGAAEAAEGAAKGESALTWSLVPMPVSTVAHWIKISRQLASDNAALAAYVDLRMRYGVDLKVDSQLVIGNGTAPNISGFMNTNNYVAHGYANAALGTVLKKLVLIRKIMADLYLAGYAPNAIVLNPGDWATIEIDLFTTAAGQTLYSVNAGGQPFLFGLPVVQAIGMTADLFAVGNFAMAGTVHNREGVVVEMSESDSDNFTKNLITIRAERRLALAIERPAAIRGGDLTPA